MQFLIMQFLLFSFLLLAEGAPVQNVMVDMTYVFDETTQNHPNWKKFENKVLINGSTDVYKWLQIEEITTVTHLGTHMDAPSHFSRGGLNIDQIPMSKLVAPAAVINIERKAAEDPNAEVTVEDLLRWERTTGQCLNGTIVLVNSGWGRKWHDRAEFLGMAGGDSTKINSPGISAEAARWLVDNRDINGVGIDTLSIDRGNTRDYPAHVTLLGRGLFAIENVANLDRIPIYGATLHAMPMKIGRGSGAPARVVATFPKVVFHALDEIVM